MGKFILNLGGHSLKIPVKLEQESFDYVGRYQIIAEIVSQYFSEKNARNILDVGGLGGFLDQVLDIPLTVLDEEASTNETGNERQGDGARMAVDDGAYDVVVTSDTLEHIPASDRKNFIKELVRVSDDLVILCAPFAGNGSAEAEAKVQKYFTGLVGHPHRWLQEHADYGLPTVAEIKTYFKQAGMEPIVFGHSTVDLWRQLMTINLVSNEMGQADVHKKLQELNQFYNENILFNDFTDKGYRMFFVGSKKRELAQPIVAAGLTVENYKELMKLTNEFYENALAEAEYVPKLRVRVKELHDETINLAERIAKTEDRHGHHLRSQAWLAKIVSKNNKRREN